MGRVVVWYRNAVATHIAYYAHRSCIRRGNIDVDFVKIAKGKIVEQEGSKILRECFTLCFFQCVCGGAWVSMRFKQQLCVGNLYVPMSIYVTKPWIPRTRPTCCAHKRKENPYIKCIYTQGNVQPSNNPSTAVPSTRKLL